MSRKKTHEEFVDELNKVNPNIEVLGEYVNNRTGIHCKCKVCGFDTYIDDRKWTPTPNHLLQGKGCPQCVSESKTSFPEQAIYYYCRMVTEAYNRYADFGKEIDVWLPKYNIGIEYNGSYYHKNRIENDKEKLDFLKNKGIRIIIVQDGEENKIKGDVIIHKRDDLSWGICELFRLLDISVDVNIDRDEQKIYEQYILQRKENSFAMKHPELLGQWDYQRNKISPYAVSSTSHKKLYRICPCCGKSYKSILERWSENGYCRECSYKKTSGGNNYKAKSVLILDSNGLQIEKFDSLKQTSDFLGINSSNLCRLYLKSHKLPLNHIYSDYEIWYEDEWIVR